MDKCQIQQSCQLCAYVNSEYRSSLDEKYRRHRATLEDACDLSATRFVPIEPSPQIFQYRTVAKLPVRKVNDAALLGLFKPGTHEIIDVRECPIHARTLKQAIIACQEAIVDQGIEPYSDSDQTGDLKFVVFRVSHVVDELMITFVVAREPNMAAMRELYKAVATKVRVKAAHVNINPDTGNSVWGKVSKKLSAATSIRDNVCGLEFTIGPGSFFQTNPWQADVLYRRVEQLVGKAHGQTSWDLYCGVGQYGLILARAGYRVVGVEENEMAIADARINARRNDLDDKVEFLAQNVDDFMTSSRVLTDSPEVVVANPSRAGLSEVTRGAISRWLKRRSNSSFMYVSCSTASFARDLSYFVEEGHIVRQVEAFDMFPHTEHIEWLAVITP